MEPVWTPSDDQRLSELVVRLRFNFPKIAQELGRDPESVRIHWTELYMSKKQSGKRKPAPANSQTSSQVGKIECPRIDFEPQRSSVLDTAGVDLTQQTSRSITGEVIHPSGFNIFKHSLKEVFTEIFTRMQTYLPTMDFPADLPEDTEPISYKITFKSGQPTIESRRGAKGRWLPAAPSIPQPNYDDINPIPAGDRPTKPPVQQVPMLLDSDEVVFRAVDAPLDIGREYDRTERELAQLFNVSEAEVKELTVHKKTAPTRFDTIKGRARVEHADSDHDSDEEAEFLAEQRRAKKLAAPKPSKPVPMAVPTLDQVPSPVESNSDSEDPQDAPNLALPTPYAVIRKRESEERAEAFRQLRLLEEQERAEKTSFRRLEEAKRQQADLDRKVKTEEEENERLKIRREAKLQARLTEEILRKEQLMRAEAEIKKQLEEEQRKRTEERVKAGNSVCFFDPITSFEAPIAGLPVGNRVKIIGIEDQPYIWPLIMHFFSNSCVFGKTNPGEEITFQLIGLVRGLFGGAKSDFNYAPGASPRAIWWLAFDLDSSSIGFNAYMEGFPLAYFIPGGIPGKTFLKEIAIEAEFICDRHLIVPIETVFSATPSFYPRNDVQTAEFEYCFAVLKPHSDPSKSQEMLSSLCEQGRKKGLDLAGCRLVHLEAGWREVYEDRFTKTLGGVDCALVLCWYGYNAIEKLHDVLGAETPELARRTDPGSVRAVFGESKERNCAYTAKLKQRVYKEMCVWFGGRVDPSSPCLTLIECPKVETAYLAVSPQTPLSVLMSHLDQLLQFGFSVTCLTRLSAESTVHCGFPCSTLTVLRTPLEVQYGWLVSIQRPAAHSHLTTLLETGLGGREMNAEEVSFLQTVNGECGNIEAMAGIGYLMATPEAFIQTADSFPVAKIGEIVAEHCEVLGLKLVSGVLPADIEADYSETVQQTVAKTQYAADKEKLKLWLETGPNLLFAYLPESPEASKRLLSALKKTLSNQAYSEYMKPSYLLVPRVGKAVFPPSELVLDPLHPCTGLLYLPTAVSEGSTALDQDLTTVCVVKPDKSLTLFRQVLKFLHRHHFCIQQAHMHHLSPSLRDLLYTHQAEALASTLDYSSFTAILAAGPCISLKLTRPCNAIKKLREIVGHPDPHLAEINTLRGSYGKSAEDNKLHCSLSYAHAKMEALRLFCGDEFLPCGVEEELGSEEMACLVGVLGESLVRILEEMKGMQLVLLDFRVSVLSESLLETYMLSFPDNHAFAATLYRTEFFALLVQGLSPAYRLTSLLQSLGLLQGFHLSSSAASLHSLTALFFPPHPF